MWKNFTTIRALIVSNKQFLPNEIFFGWTNLFTTLQEHYKTKGMIKVAFPTSFIHENNVFKLREKFLTMLPTHLDNKGKLCFNVLNEIKK